MTISIKKKGIRAALKWALQEAVVIVKGGYNPDVIVLQAGKPLKI